ncbi:MAG: cytidylate kinase family protein [Paramuribaculum sp.]|nr:cytidylate kinase family protein [Paramuribaculum sp.]
MFKRYAYFLISLFISSVGVALVTKTVLGTSPISSVPYVLSLFTPLSIGWWTALFNMLYIILEVALMSKSQIREKRFDLIMQIPVSVLFGIFIDMSLRMLYWWIPEHYLSHVATLIAGCAILAVGIAMSVQANVAMLSGDYLIRVISSRFKKEFGRVKICFDVSLVISACLISMIFSSTVSGVREGTVAAALMVGPMVFFFGKLLRPLTPWLMGVRKNASEKPAVAGRHTVITITREFGSGGRELGYRLAEKLGIKCYDRDIIAMAATESGYSEDFVESNEQSLSSEALAAQIFQNYDVALEHSQTGPDRLFMAQSRVIREIAAEKPCVIVGRCADHVLADMADCAVLSVFCYTDSDHAIERAVSSYGIDPATAPKDIRQRNELRIRHYQHFTGRRWGNPHNYQLMVNTGSVPVGTAVDLIATLYAEMQT